MLAWAGANLAGMIVSCCLLKLTKQTIIAFFCVVWGSSILLRPEEFVKGGFTVKTDQMFPAHTTLVSVERNTRAREYHDYSKAGLMKSFVSKMFSVRTKN